MKSWIWTATAIAAAAIAAQAPTQPGSPRWTYFGADADGEYYYDPASVQRAGEMVRYRMRGVMGPGRGGATRSTVIRVLLDCRQQRLSLLFVETFDGEGRRIDSFGGDEVLPRPEGILADAPEATLYRRLCPRGIVRTLPARAPGYTPVAPSVRPAPPIPVPPPLMRVASPEAPAIRAQWMRPPTALITIVDYPAAALRAEAEGRVEVTLDVSRDGRVAGCAVTRSSGSSLLDSATCSLIVRRARFRPARNGLGEPVADRVATAVIWSLPDEPEAAAPAVDAPAPLPRAEPERR